MELNAYIDWMIKEFQFNVNATFDGDFIYWYVENKLPF